MADEQFDPIPFIPGPGPIPVPPVLPGPPLPPSPPITPPKPDPEPDPEPVPVPEPPEEPPPDDEPDPEPDTPGRGVPEALPDLAKLSALLVLLGVISLATALVEMANQIIGFFWKYLPGAAKQPVIGTTTFTQGLSNKLGTWEQGIDSDIGFSFQKLGDLTSRAGHAILSGAEQVYQVASKQAALEGHTAGARAQARVATAQATAAQHTASQALQQAQTEARRAKQGEAALRKQLKGQTHLITQLLEPELEALRARIHELEKGTVTTHAVQAKTDAALGIGAMTAVVAAAMGKLGSGWTRCENNQALGKEICQMNPNKLRNLLKGLLDIGALFELCAIVGLLIDVAESSVVLDIISGFADGIEELIKCRGIDLAKPLPRKAYAALSPPTGYAALSPVG